MTRAICVAFHKYTPFGSVFYEPLYKHLIRQLSKYKNEFDTLYLIDSTWDIREYPDFARVIKVDPHLRYYDAYKEVLPKIKESSVLFIDNDMMIYRQGVIDKTFSLIEKHSYDVVSIYDTIGLHRFEQLNKKSKFCPYWFATGTAMLKDFTDCDWGEKMPLYETLGKLTEKMLDEDIKPYEWPEDKSNILITGDQDGEESKNTGTYHVRAGSTPAYLLATKAEGNKDTYWEYIKNQPRSEYLRQCAWYEYMGGDPTVIVEDAGVALNDWVTYMNKFRTYHKLR